MLASNWATARRSVGELLHGYPALVDVVHDVAHHVLLGHLAGGHCVCQPAGEALGLLALEAQGLLVDVGEHRLHVAVELHVPEVGDPFVGAAAVALLVHAEPCGLVAVPAGVAELLVLRAAVALPVRSEVRRVGKACVSTCSSWWSPY